MIAAQEKTTTGVLRATGFVSILLLFAATGMAQDVTFTAAVNTDKVALGERFQITFTLSGGSLKPYKDFRQPDLNRNFLTLSGPGTSQQMQIVNGQVSTSISWTYILQPRDAGTFTVGPASINYDGDAFKSNSLSIRVVTAVPGSKPDTKQQQQQSDVELGDNFFIRAIVSKRDVYIGEPISVTYKLYSRVAFQLDAPVKLPRMVGFWSEDIETPQQIQPEVEKYRGTQYQTYTLRRVVYFPTQTGDLSIDPFEVNCTVRVRSQRRTGDDFFDRFFSDPVFNSYRSVKKTLMTQKIAITVRELPEDGKPESFRGAVGSYTMETTLDRDTLKENETATLKTTIRGEGNIKLLEEPVVSFPNVLDSYDAKIDEQIIRHPGKISGVKKFEYLLVPRFVGQTTIEPVEFCYFDVTDGKYVTLRSESFILDVTHADEDSRSRDARKTDVDYLAMDIKPLRSGFDSEDGEEGRIPSVWFMILMYALPLLVAFLGIGLKRRYDRIHGDITGLRMRRANRAAERHLSTSRKFLESNDTDAYYLEIARAVWGYTQHKLVLPPSETSVEKVQQVMLERGVDEETVDKFRVALDATELARFSPTRSSVEEMQALYDKARQAIIRAEQSFRA